MERTRRDPDPLQLAEVASSAGVRVHAIGIGTPEGTVVEVDGFNVATALDEEQLTQIADVTDGSYHRAGDAATLAQIYESVDLKLASRRARARDHRPVRGRRAGSLLALGSLLSIAWFGRVI